jgi:hypothetical protein
VGQLRKEREVIRIATSRTMWVRRAVLFAVGLAVVVASLGMLLAAT